MYKKNSAFTLIELMIVIGLVIVMAVVVMIVINPAERMVGIREDKRIRDVQAVYGAVEQYVFHNEEFPGCIKDPENEVDLINCNDLVPEYFSELPKDPICGDDFQTGYLIKSDLFGRVGVKVRDDCREREDEIIAGVWEDPIGIGTAEWPWQITSLADLQNVGRADDWNAEEGSFANNWSDGLDDNGNPTDKYDSWEMDDYYKQQNDIDLAAGTFIPIGHVPGAGFSDRVDFHGSYNGDGHMIHNGSINQAEDSYVGLFARNDGSISNLGVAVNVNGYEYTGGLAGRNNGSIENCFSVGNINAIHQYAGGLVGHNGGSIAKSYATGNIESSNRAAGGLVGYHSGTTAIITNSYATGDVISTSNYIGGLIGESFEVVINSYSTGAPSGSWGIGGLIGSNNGTVTNSYWDINTSGVDSSAAGEGRTTLQMTYNNPEYKDDNGVLTYENWDFDFVWSDDIENINNGYPALPVTTEVEEMAVQYGLNISSSSGGYVITPGEGIFYYNESTEVNLFAEPDTGYNFENWTGDVETIVNVNSESTAITMNDHYSVLANFTEETVAGPCGGEMTLTYEGQTYGLVEIGDQCWMAENLNYAGHNEGSSSCYDNNEEKCNTYGRLYDWSGAMSACPQGWVLPSHDNFTTLERAVCETDTCEEDFPYDETTTSVWLGSDVAPALAANSELWDYEDEGLLAHPRIGDSGFNVLPGGDWTGAFGGRFDYEGSDATLWSSTEGPNDFWSRLLRASFTSIGRFQRPSGVLQSVRCLKNTE